MRDFGRFTLSIGVAALLAGCSVAQDDTQLPLGAPGTMPQARALDAHGHSANYKVVYSFGARPDGSHPAASLIDVDGTLYGTTKFGGAASVYFPSGYGTVFSLTTGGTEKVLHSFISEYFDGILPVAGVTYVNGTLYGTTEEGGTQGSYGTVFSLTTDGTEKVLHSFGLHPDGGSPVASLILVNGTLYGTTKDGANTLDVGRGTAFSITTGGTYKSLYSFNGSYDGDRPAASLIDVKGTFYGTTGKGGLYNRGTVFSLTMGGTETLIHNFGSAADGRQPLAALIEVGGVLYGTTKRGGKYDRGTIFSLTPSGTEKVLHSFGNGTDGVYPIASLIDLKGTLYGTTEDGGTYDNGTVFSVTTSGTEVVLHSFGGSRVDGRSPYAGLTKVNGTLYGTTFTGGANNNGSVFALTP